jgi:hypothetical protein
MNLPLALRIAALGLAGLGVIDPFWRAERSAPAAVELRVEGSGPAAHGAAPDVERRLTESLSGHVAFNTDDEPVARVVFGNATPPVDGLAAASVPVSTVTLAANASPNVRLVAAEGPGPLPVGWVASVTTIVEARGLTGSTSRVVLEHRGVEVAGLEHTWSKDAERWDVTLPFAPVVEGLSTVRLRAVPLNEETTAADNEVDVRVVSSARRLRVLSYESRPTWATAFIRRVLERNPAFEVSSLIRASRGLAVRAGDPPPALTAEELYPFDVVLVGAPEDLGSGEVDALRSFVRRRGGTAVLLPDRRPSGKYLELVPIRAFDEILVESPQELRSAGIDALGATELAVPRGELGAAEVLASVQQRDGARAVILTWALGAGRVLFSGALDAWRFRALGEGSFSRFWELRIAESALAAPPRLAVSVTPGYAAPGQDVTIRARVRRTEWNESPDFTRVPSVSSRLIDANGGAETIRLWPAAEIGLFEARVKAPPPGRYNVQVIGGDLSADDVLVSGSEARTVVVDEQELEEKARWIATATGGVVVEPDDLGPLVTHLRSLRQSRVIRAVHPARSPWYVLAFAALLCIEWTVRRRGGLA